MVTRDGLPDLSKSDGRTQARSSMFLAAVLRAGAEQAPVKVRNMAPNGAMIETPVTPVVGSDVILMRGALKARATVMWTSATRCGVRFVSEVSVKDWLAPPGKAQQQRVDETVALVKSGGAELPQVSSPVLGPRSPEQLIEDLEAVLSLMQDLEDELASSIETLNRHGLKLQNLDIAMQMVRAISAELAPDGDGERASIARLEDLRNACSQALGRASFE